MKADSEPASRRHVIGIMVFLTCWAGPGQADSYRACGIQTPDESRYETVEIVSIISKRIRAIDPLTRRSDGGASIDRGEFNGTGTTIRDAYGLICLQKTEGRGYVWTYSSAVKYHCRFDQAKLAKSASKAGSMGIGVGGCKQ